MTIDTPEKRGAEAANKFRPKGRRMVERLCTKCGKPFMARVDKTTSTCKGAECVGRKKKGAEEKEVEVSIQSLLNIWEKKAA